MRVASEHGHTEVVEYLIEAGADVNSIEQEPRDTSDDTKTYDDHFDRLSYDFDRPKRKLTALQAALICFERFGPTTEHGHLQSSWTKADASSQRRTIQILLEKGPIQTGDMSTKDTR